MPETEQRPATGKDQPRDGGTGFSLRRFANAQSYWTLGALVASFVLCLFNLIRSPIGEHDAQAQAQLEYVAFVAQNFALPADATCSMCDEPPLYYAIAGLFYMVGGARGVQVLSLLCSLAFVVIGVLIVRRFTSRTYTIFLTTALVGLWPYVVVNAARVHNDVLLAPLGALCVYFAVRWQQDDELRDFLIACGVAVLAVLTRSNGYALVLMLVCVVVYKLVRSDARRALLRTVGPIVLGLVAVVGGYTAVRGDPLPEGDVGFMQRLIQDAAKLEGKPSVVGTEPYNYFYFDVKGFLREPYVLEDGDDTGRQYFFNHLLKSSLFSTPSQVPGGEASYRINARVAGTLNFLLLAMLVYTATVVVRAEKRHLQRYFVPIVAILSFVLTSVVFRLLSRHGESSDFGVVLPILVPAVLGFVVALGWYRRRRSILELVGYALLVPFVVLSIVHAMPKGELAQQLSPPSFIEKGAFKFRKAVREGTKWNDKGHSILKANDVLRVTGYPENTRVARIDIGVDHNDRYQITIVGASDERTLVLGPSTKKVVGIARYDEIIEPPVENLQWVSVRPLRGDQAYSVAHVLVYGDKDKTIRPKWGEAPDEPAADAKAEKAKAKKDDKADEK